MDNLSSYVKNLSDKHLRGPRFLSLLIGIMVLVGLYLISLVNYLLFHTLLENICIVIVAGIFILTWNVRNYLTNNYLKIIGFCYGFIAVINMFHALTYGGINIIPGNGANLSMQFWMAEAYLLFITILIASFLIEGPRLSDYSIIGCFTIASFILLTAIFLGIFPDCYIEGKGLTPFKVFSEYAMIVILIASLFPLYRKRDQFDKRVFILIFFSIVVTIISEIFFSDFTTLFDSSNMAGHLLKVMAFCFIFQAILVTGLRKPFNLIFRDLKQAEDRLHMANETLEKKVSERTRELAQANRELLDEVTERKQVEEEIAWNLTINQALSSLYIPLVTAGTSIEQIADTVLKKSRQLTNSAHGYVAEIDPETGDLIAHTHKKMIQNECMMAEELHKTRFPRRADGLYNGLWGHALNTKEPLYTDVPLKHPASVGIPEEHLVIERFLVVPVLLAGEPVGQIALMNSSQAYTDRDLDAVNRFAEFYALAIQYKRAEEEIHKLNQELEQRVIDRTAQLEEANKELEAFAYSVSHDLRAPLRHIDGFIELLQKKAGTALDEQGRHYMGTISDAAKRMGKLIDDLLSFSRMGRHQISKQHVDLGELTQEIIREFEPETLNRDIHCLRDDLPVVFGDRTMLRMVLYNLISNALKFTRHRDQAQIEIGTLPGETSETVIFIRDNGVGFDMAHADKLFGVFQRLHRADEFEGTGIGLANVHRIIARHGGRTWATAELNQGATFYFSLPQT